MSLKTIPGQATLLLKIAEGSESAFSDLFEHFHNQLGEYVYFITQSEEMTEEIVQDIFLKIWTNKTRLKEIRDFTGYLFILTRNYTLNALRKTSKEQQKLAAYFIDEVENHCDPGGFADPVFNDTDIHTLLDRAIIQLPPQQQKVLLLRMQGLKNPEIATEMNLATDSVKKYYQWAIKVLKTKLQSFPEVILILCFYFPD